MQQIKLLLARLKSPSVLISIVSQVAAILVLLGRVVDVNLVTTVTAAVCSLLVTLGILSDPNTQNKGFGDDLHYCAHCGAVTPHVAVTGTLICRTCGGQTPPSVMNNEEP